MKLGIRSIVLWLALTPATLISLLLIVYLANGRIQDMEHALLTRGHGLANNLAPASEFGVLSGNTLILGQLASASLREADVSGIMILDKDNMVLVEVRKDASDSSFSDPKILQFEAPVYRTEIDVLGESQFDTGEAQRQPPAGRIIGYVRLALSRQTTTDRQWQVVRTSIALLLGCLALAGGVGYYLGRRVTNPIRRLEAAMQRLRSGHFDSHVQVDSPGELGNLERGMNMMATALRISHTRLQEQVEQATVELRATLTMLETRNAELDEAQQKAVQAAQAKSKFLANMSHEIRTPMNGITGLIDVLAKTELTPTQQGYLRTIRASAKNLMVILNDILDLSKIEAGKLELQPQDFDVRAVVEDAVLLFAFTAKEKGLELVLDIESDVPAKLMGDTARLTQILTNLVSNAIKFTECGRVAVSVAKMHESATTVTLKLTISDTGIGIAAADRQRLFDAFVQLDASTTRRFGGTGLGLPIVQRLVSLLGGRLTVESEPGLGSTFSVELPLLQQDAKTTRLSGIGKGRVIVVCADPLLVRAISHLLRFGNVVPVCTGSLLDSARLIGSLELSDTLQAIILDPASIDDVAESVEAFLTLLKASGLARRCRWIVLEGERYPVTSALSCAFANVSYAHKPLSYRELLPLIQGWSTPPVRASETSRAVTTPGDKVRLPSPARSVKALLADDNRVNRRVAEALLSQLGVAVVQARNGYEAIEACQNEPFDIIFMDIHMPNLDGFQTTRRIRSLPDNLNKNNPIIAFTADALHPEQMKGEETGLSAWLCKPITEEKLIDILATWCQGWKYPRSTAEWGEAS